MRITMFVNNFFEHDARVLREAEALAEAGHELRVIAVCGPRTQARERIGAVAVERVDADPLPAKAARALIGAFRRLRGHGDGAEIGSVGGSLLGEPEARTPAARLRGAVGGRLLRAHLDLTDRRFARKALAAAGAAPADMWVAHDLDTLGLAAAARERHGGRLVYDSHELWLERRFAPLHSERALRRLRDLERRLIAEADLVTTVSEPLAGELARRYEIGQPAVIRNLPARVDAPAENGGGVRERIGARPDTRIAIYVGGLAPDRGIEQLIEAAARIDGLEVVLLGPGNDRFLPALERQAAELGVQSRLHVLDAVPPERVVAEATGADVGLVANLHSGLNHQLTVPNRIYTCLAAGVPVVANDSPAFGHIVREHELGAVCDFGDPAAVADGIRFVLDNHERLRANALRFSERESWEREAERLVELYEG